MCLHQKYQHINAVLVKEFTIQREDKQASYLQMSNSHMMIHLDMTRQETDFKLSWIICMNLLKWMRNREVVSVSWPTCFISENTKWIWIKLKPNLSNKLNFCLVSTQNIQKWKRNSDLNLLRRVILPLNEEYFHLEALDTKSEKIFRFINYLIWLLQFLLLVIDNYGYD